MPTLPTNHVKFYGKTQGIVRIVIVASVVLAALCALALHASAAQQTEPGPEAMIIPYWVGPVEQAEADLRPYAVTSQETPVYSCPNESERYYLFSIPAHKMISVQRESSSWLEPIPAHWVPKTDLCIYKWPMTVQHTNEPSSNCKAKSIFSLQEKNARALSTKGKL
jgi:hypothetical protein